MKPRNERYRKKVIEDSDIFVKNVAEIIENKTKEQITGMLLSLFGASVMENIRSCGKQCKGKVV